MYYHIFDLDNNNLMATGRNSTTKEQVKQAISSYYTLGGDIDPKEIDGLELDDLLDMGHFSLEITDIKLNEEY